MDTACEVTDREAQPRLTVLLSSILVPSDRARREFKPAEIESLRESIRERGLINPITVTRLEKPVDERLYKLVAGERRLRACAQIPLREVPVCLFEGLSPLEQREIELDENIHRSSLTWQERIALVAEIDAVKKKVHENDPVEWTMGRTAEELQMEKSSVQRQIRFALKLKERPDLADRVVGLPMTAAMKQIQRFEEAERLDRLRTSGQLHITSQFHLGPAYPFLLTLQSGSVDLVVTDPPYGMTELADREGEAREGVNYTTRLKPGDNLSSSTVLKLLAEVGRELSRVMKDGAHLYLFTTSENHTEIWELLTSLGFDLEVQPLIWNKGLATTVFTGYNYPSCYEQLIFGHRAKRSRRLVKPTKSILEFPPVHSNLKLHPFEKPPALLEFLIEQSTVKGEVVLDPFAGSAATLCAALRLGRQAIGCEIDPEHYNLALGRLAEVKARQGVV